MIANPHPLSSTEAWEPLPLSDWDEAAARHLLQRIGFSAPPTEVARALADGPGSTLERCFASMPAFPKPRLVAQLEAETPDLARRLTGADADAKRVAAQEARERSREALFDLTIKWLQQASVPANSPAEKWLLFLQDVWVVGVQKVKNTALIYQHQDILRQHALGGNVALARAVSRSPAMIMYLDLQQRQPEAPNENFARELFELFTLGEGHYAEADIKEAARAFTGYRQRQGRFIFAPRQHDPGVKKVFGQSGAFTGDDVIDLVFRQPAAGAFLPRELARFYLTDVPLPAGSAEALGAWWAADGYDLRRLALRFFGSRLFFDAAYRDAFIKSPLQFYLGLIQDLELSVAPLARPLMGVLRQMGQMPFDPPNVRGWVGGRAWINSATLAARRQLIEALLRPIDEAALNADEQIELAAAYADGVRNFTLDPGRLGAWAQLPAARRAQDLTRRFVPALSGTAQEHEIAAFLDRGAEHSRADASTRLALASLLESPHYQLC